jgi:hypothetical protein
MNILANVAGTDLQPDAAHIEAFLSGLIPGVYEIRVTDPRRPRFWQLQHMYLQLPDDLVAGVSILASVRGQDAAAVYIVGNPLDPALSGRGRASFYRAKSTASDADVIRRRLLYVDVDATRPSGINASAEEAAAAHAVTDRAARWLIDEWDFPDPWFLGSSGSGGMILFRADLPNDPDVEQNVRTALEAIAAEFNTKGDADQPPVKVDTSVFNAARLFRVPGTVNAKSNTPQPDRPWTLVTGTFNAEAGVLT